MTDKNFNAKAAETPVVTEMSVIPVAGYDSMLFNLCGAHAPFFTRNIVILKDNAGHVGVGEVPGGETICRTLEKAKPLVVGQSIGLYNNILNGVRKEVINPGSAEIGRAHV
jgi:glucarate dehydratase